MLDSIPNYDELITYSIPHINEMDYEIREHTICLKCGELIRENEDWDMNADFDEYGFPRTDFFHVNCPQQCIEDYI